MGQGQMRDIVNEIGVFVAIFIVDLVTEGSEITEDILMSSNET